MNRSISMQSAWPWYKTCLLYGHVFFASRIALKKKGICTCNEIGRFGGEKYPGFSLQILTEST